MHLGRSGFGRITAAVAAGACCLAAAACGGSSASLGTGPAPSASSTVDPLASLTGAQIRALALADATAAPSLTIVGSGTQSGQTLSVNLDFKHGQGCAGSVGEGSQGSLKIIEIGQTVYINADNKFWTANSGSDAPAIIALVDGRWIQTTTASKQMAGVLDLCNPSKVLTSDDAAKRTITKGPVSTLNGTRVLQIKESNGTVAYVTDTSEPQIVQINAPKGAGTIKVTAGAPVTLTAPPASQVIDGSKLGF
jgi:hypothetical protein